MDFGPSVSTYANKKVGVYGGKFFPFHKGHQSYILKAQSMVDVLFVAVQYDEEHERKLIENTDKFEWVDPKVREAWIAESFKAFPNIRVLSQYEHRSPEHMNDPLIEETYRELKEAVGGHIDIIFSNTHEYDGYFAKYVPEAEHVVFYESRDMFDISATQIREGGVYKYWDYLPKVVQKHYTKRVVLCGIESSGKTHLSNMLAETFNSVAVPEYGRTYYDDKNAYSDIDNPIDYIDIAAGHCHLINEAVKSANKVLFVDTDLIYTQFFHVTSYGRKHEALDVLIKAQADKIDKRIWIEPHNPHELDGTRLDITDETRRKNREILMGLYEEYGVELEIVDETNRDDRFQKCLQISQSVLD